MKRLVISISGLLPVMYLSARPPTTWRTPANGSQHNLAKAAPKTLGQLLTQNKKLSDKLSVLLTQQNPSVTDLQAASQGFRNLDQLVVAVHTSHNLGIPFDQLKTAAQASGSLSKAIQLLKPDAHVESEIRKAVLQALNDLDKTPGVLLAQNKKLSKNTNNPLTQHYRPLTDMQAASQGFTNLGELFTAVHISHNLGIPFDQLKKHRAPASGSLSEVHNLITPDETAKAE